MAPESVLRGGNVLDTESRQWRRVDVGITGDRITRLETDVEAPGAHEVDVRGRLVVPGLVDIHSHVYEHVTTIGLSVSDMTFPGCVTATADAGSSGSETFQGFRRWIAEPAAARVFCFVNFSRLGLIGASARGELVDRGYADPDGVRAILTDFPDVAVGIKVRVSSDMVGGSCLPVLSRARAVAAECNRPLLVHIGDSLEPLSDVLDVLGPGDIVTHCQTPKANGLLDEKRRLWPAVREARARGVLFDSGHGRTHFDLTVARCLLEQEFPPDTLSTDISRTSFADLAPGLLSVVNKWMAIGMSLTDALVASTTRAADSIVPGAEWGRLSPGQFADIAVLEIEHGSFEYRDAAGHTVRADSRLIPSMTLRNGHVVWDASPTSSGQSPTR